MSPNALAELNPDATTAKRAQYEAFEFELDAPGLVLVRNGSYDDASEHEYRVNVEHGVPTVCECPAFQYRNGACKHMVAVAIRLPVLVAASEYEHDYENTHTPEVATDGGVITERNTDTDSDDNEHRTKITKFAFWSDDWVFWGHHWQCECCTVISSRGPDEIQHDAGCPNA
jgi:hypothetical protein